MSDVDILDLMKLFAFVEIEQLLNNFEDIVCSQKVMCCFDDIDYIKTLMNIIRIANLKIIDVNYQATRMKLLKYHDRNEPVVLLDQFKSLGIMSLQCAEQSLKALLVSEVKCLDKTCSENGLFKVYVIKESNKEIWNELKDGKSNSFWNGKLQTFFRRFFQCDDGCRTGSLLPIVACLLGDKEVTTKIGFLRSYHSDISWIQQEYLIKDEKLRNDVNKMSYSKIENFKLLKYVFQMMMEDRKTKATKDKGTKYIGMTISKGNFIGFPEEIVLEKYSLTKNLEKWFHQNKDNDIYILFILDYQNGPCLGVAEVTSFNSCCMTLSWCLKSSDGIKLPVEPRDSEHLNNQVFVIENGKEVITQCEMQFHDSSIEAKRDSSKEDAPFVQITLEDISYLDIKRPAQLINFDNSCYLASMLQCLKTCFYEDDCGDYYHLNPGNTPLSFALFQTLYLMFSSQYTLDASDLRTELGKYSNKFDTGSQQDGFEFLMCLMNKVEKELSESGFNSEKTNGLSKDIFKNKFSFEIQSTWNCKAGHAGESSQLEYAVHVSPHSSEKVELKDCWNEVFGEDEIEQILCQECPGNEQTFEGLLKRTIKNPPEVLIIYVNRWDFNRRSKNEDFLVFELDDFEVNHLGGTSLYSTVAFCEHRGTLNSGHYLAYVRGTNHGVWFKCDDLQDKLEAFQQRDKRVGSRNVYAIFYRRKEMIPR